MMVFFLTGGELKKFWTVYFPKEGISKLRNTASELTRARGWLALGQLREHTGETPNSEREFMKGCPRYRHLHLMLKNE